MTGPQLTHTQKTRRLIIIGSLLLLVLAGMVGAVLWSDARRATPLTQIPADLQSIRIQRAEFPDTLLQVETGAQWRITQPCTLPVNAQRLQPLLDALAPAAMSYAAGDVDLESAGLLNPEAVIIMNGQKLALGITDLSGERRYLQRAERVEFVPEWVLSLVNGGLSALALLDVFPRTLDELLILQSDQSAEPASLAVQTDALPDWQALQAQQIVTWPLQDSEPVTDTYTLIAKAGDQELNLTLELYTRFAALRYEDADCAYLLPIPFLPDIALP